MMRRFSVLAAALVLALTTMAPTGADARDRHGRGYYDRGYYGGHYDHRRRYRDNNDEAVVAGVVGLVLGLALGAAASQPREPRYQERCYDNYRRCAPPQQGYYAPPQQQGYYQGGNYEDPRSAYEQDYGYAPPPPSQAYYAPPQQQQCMRRERQWDRYANQYVTVDVPC